MLQPTDPTQAFSYLLDRLLKPSGKSRREFAIQAKINVHFLWQIEHGLRNPSQDTMDKIRKWAMLYHAGDLRKRVLLDLKDDWKYVDFSQKRRKRKVNIKVDGKKYIYGG